MELSSQTNLSSTANITAQVNRFIISPPKCVVYDPITNRARRAFVFLGDVPKNIAAACLAYHDTPNDKLLKEFYGPSFKSKLGLDIKDPSRAWLSSPEVPEFLGGADGLDDDDISLLLGKTTRVVAKPAAAMYTSPGIEYVTNVHLFPEDRFSDARDKLHIVTGIPMYRQHIFYISYARLRSLYQIEADGVYDADIRLISQYTDNIQGIPIDKTLYDRRGVIRVEAHDDFKILGKSLSEAAILYVTDLAQFTRTSMSGLLNDTYQFDLLYYGFVVKFWPQLTRECFHDYIRDEGELRHKYPELAKDKAQLTSVYREEREIITTNYRNLPKATAWANSNCTFAITQMTAIVVGGRVALNIRNLFDRLRATKCIPEIHAYIEHEGKKYLLRKRDSRNGSDIQFPPGAMMKTGVTLAISLRKADQDAFHTRTTASTAENEQSRYLFLNIMANGKYLIRTLWDEEDELNFDGIIKIMQKFTDPIVDDINSLGKYVFISGASIPKLTKLNVNYQGLNICIFWKKVMLESTFKLVRALWDDYMRARITGTRNVQQVDKYEFMFRKGMHEFDTSAIDRILSASNQMEVGNQYAHLSNNTIKQKWDQNYDGRIVRMTHRTTDVRFEVSDIRESEFQIFQRFITVFAYNAMNNPNIKFAMGANRSYKNVKKLRKLREQDPELFNLKKYGSKRVYSRVCQNQFQPLIYTAEELKAAGDKKLVQYWNFTTKKPAYYECPNKKYPHLSFIVGVHPKNYCLPCCNKRPQNDSSGKRSVINSICLRKHTFIESEAAADSGISRHIMNYGKDVDIGRLSKLPQTSLKNLLYGSLDEPGLNYYVCGVAQHTPGAENVGIIHSIAECLEMTIETLTGNIIAELKKPHGLSLYNVLLEGTLVEYFSTIDHLVASMRELFIDMKMFSIGTQRFTHWSELFVELVHNLFKVAVYTFIDESGSGTSVDLHVSGSLRNEIMTIVADQTYLVLIRKQNRCYPIFATKPEAYFKTLEIKIRTWNRDSKTVQLLNNIVRYDARLEAISPNKIMDLSLVLGFIRAGSSPPMGSSPPTAWTLLLKLINKQNLCYAVILSSGADRIYIPVDYCNHSADGFDVSFGALDRAAYNLPYSAVVRFVGEMNEFIKTTYSASGVNEYKLLELSRPAALASAPSVTIGCYILNMFCYVNVQGPAPVEIINHDYSLVNKAIIDRTTPVRDAQTDKIGEALYDNYAYQLFTIEFVNYLNNEKNKTLRGALIKLIRETDFKGNAEAFRASLRKLLAGFPADYAVMQQQLAAFHKSNFDKPSLFEQIEKSTYDFDRAIINRLGTLTAAELRAELMTLSKEFAVQTSFDTTGIKFPNIYMPCAELIEKTGYCVGKKLMINKPLDEFVDLLAADLKNELKSKYLLDSVWADTVIDYLNFTKYPSELITVYRLPDRIWS